ncbi:MBL fold metallo-hydrolase [Streptomyces sp. WMMB 322]|uniref:MBL fold metallo-hydrolase n=1 Tax=Streptomyces sp. WMMB 322 TaxID=1286821 RepID=UPI0006E2367B|nr:MBL fold metallo-hydrolase [Streptomyces sp. WMMB 322]SCK35661.1 Ribonuclease BN, tRNA processing enzyme [Streptomyces sp. WMMB 322]
MELTVLGGCGAWPTSTQGCSGYLVTCEGFRLLIDPGYATLPALLGHAGAEQIDAVLVSHGHPDHCADLNPLLRARALGGAGPARLPLYALPGALDAVLALDRHGMLADAWTLHEFTAGARFEIGPFTVDTVLLPHFVPNAGIRLTSPRGTVLAYTGDTGPSPQVPLLAQGADIFLCEATYPETVPREDAEHLLSARLAGRYAQQAGAAGLLLTHLWPGTPPEEALRAARATFRGPLAVAAPGQVLEVGAEVT